MDLLLSALKNLPEFLELYERTGNGGCPAALTGLSHIHKVHITAALAHLKGCPVVVVCPDELTVSKVTGDLTPFLGQTPAVIPTRELTLYHAAAVSREWEHKRISSLFSLAHANSGVWVSSLDALLQRTIPSEKLEMAQFSLSLGQTCPMDELSIKLIQAGYKRSQQVEGAGQYAVRGGILDVFSPAYEYPVRMEFFGDELDSMGFFNPATQRRTENLKSAQILPAAETLPQLHDGGISGLIADLRALYSRITKRKNPNPALLKTLSEDIERLGADLNFTAIDRYMSLIYPDFTISTDYIPQNAIVVLYDQGKIAQRAKNLQMETGQDLDSLLQSGILAGELCDFYSTYEQFIHKISTHPIVILDSFMGAAYPEGLQPKKLMSLPVKQLPSYGGSLETAISDLKHYQHVEYSTVVLCGSLHRAENLQSLLKEHGISAVISADTLPRPGQVHLMPGSLSAGLEYPSLKLAILTEGQISSPAIKRTVKSKKATNRQKLVSFTDLSPGDLVVHEYHGIGRFVSIEQIQVDGVVRDYIKIAYSGTDSLFLPATQLDLISKYIGGGEDSPVRLNKLGGDVWAKTKARAKSAAKDLAQGLIALYAERKKQIGHAFAPDCSFQSDFEDAFEYTETEDQLRCVDEIKRDMELPVPMDRLLCGDVGFGKTEVALRAVMKCILDGKQAAILVPTTVLAQQHYLTCLKRFSGFPISIDVLSRFRTASQHKKTIRAISAGTVDLVIGTHRLLQKDVKFKDLGLLIVDEEQRFGVTHKERLKELSQQVDALTLSATPIPRTLNMALSGIRDMSTIEEPPQDRYPVQTYIMEHDWAVIGDAIRRELARGGQVYYLHNRIDNIERIAARIADMEAGVSVSVAHGRMNENQLSDVMQQMADGEIQVLVCTTIIETGIDIPNVNTLIIEDADRFGLAQLHQLRGRVGRSSRHAFAYLTFRQGKVLTDMAEKRLSAIREFAEFGSGFKIAMRDLEIRGAGNVLGPEQSGHMISVGYDMYLKLLEEAVLEERGEIPVESVNCAIDLVVSASIPNRYVPSEEQRIDLYRRISAIRSQEDAEDLTDELIDRFGDPPGSVSALISVALLRSAASMSGISDISQKSGQLVFTLNKTDFAAVSAVCEKYKGRVIFSAGETPYLSLRILRDEPVLKLAEGFVIAYCSFLQDLPSE